MGTGHRSRYGVWALRSLLAALALIAAYIALVALTNVTARPVPRELDVRHGAQDGAAPPQLTLTTWNIGYAGLGRESDFVAGGGEHYFPPSRQVVLKNLRGIQRTIASIEADVFLIQELAEGGLHNYSVNVRSEISDSLRRFDASLMNDFKTRWLFPPLRLVSGSGIFSRFRMTKAFKRPLPLEPTYYLGVFRRLYGAHVAHIPIAGSDQAWIVINIHLAVFDKAARVRYRQARKVFEIARAEYERGNYVVIGGDWNMEFDKPDYDHSTDEKYLFWVYPFPDDLPPEGWRLAFDKTQPSHRTTHQSYVPGVNYVTVLDGFALSPNVELVSVRTTNLGFEFSDHQPVTVTVRAGTGLRASR